MRYLPIHVRRLAKGSRLRSLLPRGPTALVLLLGLAFIPFLVRALVKTEEPNPKTTDNQALHLARLSERISVRASGRGNPTINLSNGHELLTSYVGPEELRTVLDQNLAEPLSLASADFDEDGVPDLVGGYAYNGRGIVTVMRGNVDSIYPNAPDTKQRQQNGAFTDAPFLSPARVFSTPVAADFIGAGDFDGDSHWDVVLASRSSDKLHLLSGEGHGGLQPAKEIQLPGVVTAFVAGETNRANGLTDIVVGVAGPDGPKVLIFEGPEGALRSRPEILSAPATVTSLSLGQLDDDLNVDLAVAAGSDLLLVHGRDRKLSLNENSRADVRPALVEARSFNFNLRSLVVGQFSGKARPDVALLSEDGVISFVNPGLSQNPGARKGPKAVKALVKWQSEALAVSPWPAATQLTSARFSSNPVDDLVAIDSLNRQLHVMTRPRLNASSAAPFGEFDINQTSPREVSLEVESLVQAVLPMKLNNDALSDLVVLRKGQSAPTVIATTPSAIITVNSNADTNVRDDVITLREAILLSNGDLLKSALTANEQGQVNGTPAPGLDEVRFNIPAAGSISPPESTVQIATADKVAQPVAENESEAEKTEQARVNESYGRLPLSFEVNEGQHDSRVQFLARGRGYNLFLTSNEAVMQLSAGDRGSRKSKTNPGAPGLSDKFRATQRNSRDRKSEVVRVKLLNANPDACVMGADELPGKVNYFIGNDPSKWRTDVRRYAKVRYERVYPGIDLVYYGNQGQLEYDFVLAPGADPNLIKLSYQGIKKLTLDEAGDLVLHTPRGQLVQRKPLVYQDLETGRREVAGRYEVGRNQVGFRLDDYDSSKPLIIDPVLIYSTYLGGGGDDFSQAIAVDSAGSAYVTGFTNSINFPTQSALQSIKGSLNDVFITKLSADGSSLVYSTYLGGNEEDYGYDVAVNSLGNAYVAGFTRSTNFPVQNALQPVKAASGDPFITKLSVSGSALEYSTYLGGDSDEECNAIAVDGTGNAYITGRTLSSNFSTPGAFQTQYAGGADAFVRKLNAAGSALIYSTYLGGSALDTGYGIAVDTSGNAYVTGETNSGNFPTANPLQPNHISDAFVTKLNPAGSALVYSTYLGGTDAEEGLAIAVDNDGRAYVTGYTRSSDFPVANPLQAAIAGIKDIFVSKLNASGSAFVYSTYLGGCCSETEYGYDIAVDSAGNAYVIGYTDAVNFPVANAVQVNNAGTNDLVVTKLNAAGSALLFSTYLGGGGAEEGKGIVADSAGNVYITGTTRSNNFPTKRPLQASFAGGNFDSFIAKIDAFNQAQPDLSITKQHSGNFAVGTNGAYALTVTNVGTVSTTGTITVTDTLPNGLNFISGNGTGWNFSVSGQTITCTNTATITPNASSGFNLTVGVTSAAAPSVTNTATVTTDGDGNTSNNTAADPTTVTVPCVQPINLGQTINGVLATSSCRSPIRGNNTYADRYAFTGTAGEGVTIGLSAAFDTYLYLIGPDSSVIASDDDGGGGANSRIPALSGFFTLPTTGTYTIEATSLSINQTGAYTLTLSSGAAGCSFQISPNTQAFNAGGGTGNVTVTTPGGCAWDAISKASWITVTSGATGSGNGSVGYTVAANPDPQGRSGTITVAGQTFTVTQSASGACSYAISPLTQDFAASGGNGVVSITTGSTCNWTAASNAGFLGFSSATSGTGNGFVIYTVAANSGIARNGSLTVAGRTFIAQQAGVNPNLRTITLTSPLPKITDPITIDGATQPGFAGVPIIEINGANLISTGGGDGLNITAGSSTVRSLVINRISSLNRDSDILLITNGGNVVEGCYLGSDPSGAQGFSPNGTNALAAGVSMRSSSGNLIGGTTIAARNLISGVDGSGVIITNGATGNLIQGNYIGPDVTGTLSVGTQRIGVYIQAASGNTVGGTQTGAGNLISGNIDYGVYLQDDAQNNLVIGNIIGANGSGTAALPNNNAGVFIYNPSGAGVGSLNNTIGGTTNAGRNVISGNNPYGVVLGQGATGTLVQGNYIGTTGSGAAALPNSYGVIATQATGSTIGGAVDAARNVISGNTLTGVSIGFLNNGQLGGTGTTIQRNYIGTNAAGIGPLGNLADGVFVEVQSVTHTVQENVIAFNGSNGVRIPDVTANPGTPGLRIQIVDNSVYSNGALGIDLGNAGITLNDTDDTDAGANLQQNFPVLTSAVASAATETIWERAGEVGREMPDPILTAALTINGTLNSTPNTNFTVHWYFSADAQCTTNQAASRPLAFGKIPNVITNGGGNAMFSIPFDFPAGTNGGIVNCTATDPQGNTSEFSACFPLGNAPVPTPTPTPSPTPTGPTIFVEQSTNSLAAVDSVTFVRGPFPLTNPKNFSSDPQTRILFFTTNLGLPQTSQPPTSTLSVQVGGNSHPVETVGPNTTTGGSQIVFRLPNLSPGTYPLGIRLNGVNSTNTPNLIISGPSGSPAGGPKSNKAKLAKYFLFPHFDLTFLANRRNG